MGELDGPVGLGERRCHDCSKVMPITSFSRVRGLRTDVCVMCAAVRVRDGLAPPDQGAVMRNRWANRKAGRQRG